MKQRFPIYGDELSDLIIKVPVGVVVRATIPATHLELDLENENDRAVGKTLIAIRQDRKLEKTCEALEAAYSVIDAVA